MERIDNEIKNNIIKDLLEVNKYGNYKYTQEYLCKKYNVSLSSISSIARKNDIRRNKKAIGEIKDSIIKDLKEVDEYGCSKYSQEYLCKKYKISRPIISSIVKENNIIRCRGVSNKLVTSIIKDLKELDEYGYNKYKDKYKDICKKYNISHNTICDIVKKYNIRRRKKCKLDIEIKNNIIKDLKEIDEYGYSKYSQEYLCKKYKVSYSVISNILKENKIKRNKKYKVDNEIKNNIIKDLKEIDEYGCYKYTKTKIAKKYNLSCATISNIMKDNNSKRREL